MAGFRMMSQFFMFLDHEAKISVWWNIDDCKVPTNLESVTNISNNIPLVLLKAKLHGEISITAYGDTNLISSEILNGISSTGMLNEQWSSLSDCVGISWQEQVQKKVPGG
ncbi:NYN domain protein [Medicago truncatula]|uniref:NYN domain protein n=1 Tax=Medicago truncatula TaxID=3880 RepID=G7I5X9_MEDTR|nr:NYN domain protein [Medicago truncatula]